jgi:hypothetical protein
MKKIKKPQHPPIGCAVEVEIKYCVKMLNYYRHFNFKAGTDGDRCITQMLFRYDRLNELLKEIQNGNSLA